MVITWRSKPGVEDSKKNFVFQKRPKESQIKQFNRNRGNQWNSKLVYYFWHVFIYLKELWKERERHIFQPWVNSPDHHNSSGMVQAEARNQEPRLGLPGCWQRLEHLGHLLLFLECVSKDWIGSGTVATWTSTHMQCWHSCKWLLYLLHHSASPQSWFLINTIEIFNKTA